MSEKDMLDQLGQLDQTMATIEEGRAQQEAVAAEQRDRAEQEKIRQMNEARQQQAKTVDAQISPEGNVARLSLVLSNANGPLNVDIPIGNMNWEQFIASMKGLDGVMTPMLFIPLRTILFIHRVKYVEGVVPPTDTSNVISLVTREQPPPR